MSLMLWDANSAIFVFFSARWCYAKCGRGTVQQKRYESDKKIEGIQVWGGIIPAPVVVVALFGVGVSKCWVRTI